MFRRNLNILKDTEPKMEASTYNRPRPVEVNLGGPLPDALPTNDNTIELLKRMWPGADVEIYLITQDQPTVSEVNKEPEVNKVPEPEWPYMATTDICYDVFQEVKRATQKHASMNSPHEGYAVILEELDELWAHVKADTGRSPEARKEAIQVAAMAVRYVLDLEPGRPATQ